MSTLKSKLVTFTKISDDKFDGNHPNNIIVGSVLGGYLVKGIIIGEPAILFTSNNINDTLTGWTSIVKSFDLDKMILKTENSTYQVEEINLAQDQQIN